VYLEQVDHLVHLDRVEHLVYLVQVDQVGIVVQVVQVRLFYMEPEIPHPQVDILMEHSMPSTQRKEIY
jgi:hypothetical protein